MESQELMEALYAQSCVDPFSSASFSPHMSGTFADSCLVLPSSSCPTAYFKPQILCAPLPPSSPFSPSSSPSSSPCSSPSCSPSCSPSSSPRFLHPYRATPSLQPHVFSGFSPLLSHQSPFPRTPSLLPAAVSLSDQTQHWKNCEQCFRPAEVRCSSCTWWEGVESGCFWEEEREKDTRGGETTRGVEEGGERSLGECRRGRRKAEVGIEGESGRGRVELFGQRLVINRYDTRCYFSTIEEEDKGNNQHAVKTGLPALAPLTPIPLSRHFAIAVVDVLPSEPPPEMVENSPPRQPRLGVKQVEKTGDEEREKETRAMELQELTTTSDAGGESRTSGLGGGGRGEDREEHEKEERERKDEKATVGMDEREEKHNEEIVQKIEMEVKETGKEEKRREGLVVEAEVGGSFQGNNEMSEKTQANEDVIVIDVDSGSIRCGITSSDGSPSSGGSPSVIQTMNVCTYPGETLEEIHGRLDDGLVETKAGTRKTYAMMTLPASQATMGHGVLCDITETECESPSTTSGGGKRRRTVGGVMRGVGLEGEETTSEGKTDGETTSKGRGGETKEGRVNGSRATGRGLRRIRGMTKNDQVGAEVMAVDQGKETKLNQNGDSGEAPVETREMPESTERLADLCDGGRQMVKKKEESGEMKNVVETRRRSKLLGNVEDVEQNMLEDKLGKSSAEGMLTPKKNGQQQDVEQQDRETSAAEERPAVDEDEVRVDALSEERLESNKEVGGGRAARTRRGKTPNRGESGVGQSLKVVEIKKVGAVVDEGAEVANLQQLGKKRKAASGGGQAIVIKKLRSDSIGQDLKRDAEEEGKEGKENGYEEGKEKRKEVVDVVVKESPAAMRLKRRQAAVSVPTPGTDRRLTRSANGGMIRYYGSDSTLPEEEEEEHQNSARREEGTKKLSRRKEVRGSSVCLNGSNKSGVAGMGKTTPGSNRRATHSNNNRRRATLTVCT
eukprot:GHVS01097543.1.p1 GENE.GHVS01097543.1~~GHVS01097543.1.p1  ORF type:complete len:957 (-),score=232.53 GHVS01097543.1:745-3615(-)